MAKPSMSISASFGIGFTVGFNGIASYFPSIKPLDLLSLHTVFCLYRNTKTFDISDVLSVAIPYAICFSVADAAGGLHQR